MTEALSLEELSARVAIRELVARYNRAFDDGDAETWATTFTDDGVFEIVDGPVAEGHAVLREFARQVGYGPVHTTTDACIELDGDRARHTSSLSLARRSTDRRSISLISTGRYEDELVRGPDGWRFASRRVTLDVEPSIALGAFATA